MNTNKTPCTKCKDSALLPYGAYDGDTDFETDWGSSGKFCDCEYGQDMKHEWDTMPTMKNEGVSDGQSLFLLSVLVVSLFVSPIFPPLSFIVVPVVMFYYLKKEGLTQ